MPRSAEARHYPAEEITAEPTQPEKTDINSETYKPETVKISPEIFEKQAPKIVKAVEQKAAQAKASFDTLTNEDLAKRNLADTEVGQINKLRKKETSLWNNFTGRMKKIGEGISALLGGGEKRPLKVADAEAFEAAQKQGPIKLDIQPAKKSQARDRGEPPVLTAIKTAEHRRPTKIKDLHPHAHDTTKIVRIKDLDPRIAFSESVAREQADRRARSKNTPLEKGFRRHENAREVFPEKNLKPHEQQALVSEIMNLSHEEALEYTTDQRHELQELLRRHFRTEAKKPEDAKLIDYPINKMSALFKETGGKLTAGQQEVFTGWRAIMNLEENAKPLKAFEALWLGATALDQKVKAVKTRPQQSPTSFDQRHLDEADRAVNKKIRAADRPEQSPTHFPATNIKEALKRTEDIDRLTENHLRRASSDVNKESHLSDDELDTTLARIQTRAKRDDRRLEKPALQDIRFDESETDL